MLGSPSHKVLRKEMLIMAVENECINEYIGARYVPLIADPVQWEQSKAYEHLMIVTNLNKAYISRYAVPAGTELTDERYWVVFLDNSPVITDIEAKIEAIKSELATQASDISDIREVIKNINADATELTQRVQQNENDIAAIQTEQATQNEEITKLKTSQAEQDERLSEIVADASTLSDRVTHNERDISAIQTEQATQNEDIENLKTSQEEQDTEIENIKQINSAQQNDIADLQTRTTTAEQQITIHGSALETLQTEQRDQNIKIANLESLTNAQQIAIAKNASDIIDLQARTQTLSDTQSAQEERLNNQELELNNTNNALSNIQSSVANQDTKIATITQQYNDLHDDVNVLQSASTATNKNVSDLTESLTQTNTTITNIQNDLEEIHEKLDSVPESVTELTEKVNTNTQNIVSNDTDILSLQNITTSHTNTIGNLSTELVTAKEELDSQKVIVDNLTDDMQSQANQIAGVINKADTNTQDIASIMQQLQRIKYVYNILDYGAVGDNVTDNRDAFQRFFQETKELAKTQYVTLVIPGGKYKIDGQIEFCGKYFIIGLSQAMLIITSGQGAPNIYVGGSERTRGGFFNMNFSGSGNIEYMNLTNCEDFIIYNCRFDTPSNCIVLVDDVFLNKKIQINSCVFSDTIIKAITDSSNSTNEYIFIEKCIFERGLDTAVSFNHSARLSIKNNFFNCNTGMHLLNCYDSTITGNFAKVKNTFLSVQHLNFSVVSNNIILHRNKNGGALYLELCYQIIVTSNNINTEYEGIVMNSCDRITISQNQIGNLTPLDTDSAGILITQGFAYLISQNIISNLNYGMSISRGEALKGLIITSNMIFNVNVGLEMQSGITNGVNENNVIVVR